MIFVLLLDYLNLNMKITTYIRVAQGGKKGFRVDASNTPNPQPLKIAGGYNRPDEFLPTVSFAVNFDIPEELFNQAETIIGEINIGLKQALVTNEITIPKGIKIKK